MPNFSSFNPNPDNLRTLIFGQDQTQTARAVATDTEGRILNIIMDGTITSISGVTISGGTVSVGTISNLLNGTITSVMGATITAGTLTNLLNGTITSVMGATITAGTLSNLLDGTITNVMGATITAGTLTNLLNGTLTNLLNGTITSVMGATITAGTLTNLLNGTITSVMGATITAGTLTNLLNGTITSVMGATITAGTLTNLLNGTITSVMGATITAGTLSSVTSISQKSFVEQSNSSLPTADAYTALNAVTTSVLGTYSFFVYNRGPGTNKADARVEISADGTNWYTDVDTSTGIAVGGVDVLVPQRFLKYTRLAYKSAAAGNATTVDVFFNGQGT
ncbi:DUF6385 domain-containing protein [Paenibacillus albus]|uniref:DUF6385 domain-containing protein n=1 Tax=Paenibacillus albus TaxID=2495582 RepID=A0A3Q8X3W8_9BACL|nr:DUF6385 domain-containing protein [Paenibacillus albus]AZN38663.1 hypothetical protein EJC50_02445 [Paenibacillus albus]